MPQIKYEVAGVENVETIPAELVDFYRDRPGYTLVYTDAEAAELTGAELLEVARNVGVDAPTTLTADEKRDAIVAATAPTERLGAGGPLDAAPAVIVNDTDDGVPIITPDPEPATEPSRTTKRRTAASDKES